ncbi:MAG: sugar phosphate isomerase/epimerase family protein [Pirellulaceae bacterium]|jgi:hexulose-6-phosphate isomerase|nr:sugar phosphate isomerase/epimerase family protein [Pirellulaceae bacterium]MDP6720059.1 sugar phosphate isomerase/epimerase family protein [Pirellulaceae bacterium]
MPTPLNRRTFLQTTAAIGAATALTTAGQTEAGSFTGKIKKAVKYHMITEPLSVMDKLKMVKDVGFDGVEPRTADAVKHRGALLKASQATGVKVHGVVNSSNPDIVTAVDAAKDLGATSVLLVVPTNAKGSYLKNYAARQDIIRRAIPHAEKQGIKLLIENVWASFLNEPLSMARFVDELKSPMVGVYFDVGNNIRWGYAGHWIEVLDKRIGKLDIKEYSRKLQNDKGLRAGFSVEIGEGSVDWSRVRDELAKIDYTGWATAEVKGGDRKRLQDISTRMNKVLDL